MVQVNALQVVEARTCLTQQSSLQRLWWLLQQKYVAKSLVSQRYVACGVDGSVWRCVDPSQGHVKLTCTHKVVAQHGLYAYNSYTACTHTTHSNQLSSTWTAQTSSHTAAALPVSHMAHSTGRIHMSNNFIHSVATVHPSNSARRVLKHACSSTLTVPKEPFGAPTTVTNCTDDPRSST